MASIFVQLIQVRSSITMLPWRKKKGGHIALPLSVGRSVYQVHFFAEVAHTETKICIKFNHNTIKVHFHFGFISLIPDSRSQDLLYLTCPIFVEIDFSTRSSRFDLLHF